jgi:hypothetical protein
MNSRREGGCRPAKGFFRTVGRGRFSAIGDLAGLERETNLILCQQFDKAGFSLPAFVSVHFFAQLR